MIIHPVFISPYLYWTHLMKSIVPITMLALCSLLEAQNPPGQPPPPGQQQAPGGTQQNAPVPQPGNKPVPNPQLPQSFLPPAPAAAAASESIALTLESALGRARQYSQQWLTANFAAQIAHEDTVQARAALLPTADWFNQVIYTQPNGTDTGIFVANNGTHVYANQAIVHAEIYNPGKLADYRRTIAAEAVARARAEIAARGLIAVVVQDYYGLLVAQRKLANAEQSLQEASDFLDITRKQELGGEAARADVVKAQIQYEQRRVDVLNAQLDVEKARIALGVTMFPNYGQRYTITDDLETATPLPPFNDIQERANRNNPDIRAAQATITQQTYEMTAARAAFYPTLSFDYFYGIEANQYAIHNSAGYNQVGSVAQAQLTVPVWNWGATRSRVRQAELRLQQARTDLTFTQRQLISNLNSFYAEAGLSAALLDSLRHTVDLAVENLRLTRLRYQAGEATAQEVVDAQTTLAGARNALADGLIRYRLALANLQTLTGAF
jgi:outer membrane protein TolC